MNDFIEHMARMAMAFWFVGSHPFDLVTFLMV